MSVIKKILQRFNLMTSYDYKNLCASCNRPRQLGSLPCHYRIDYDIAEMEIGKPRFIIVDCPGYK